MDKLKVYYYSNNLKKYIDIGMHRYIINKFRYPFGQFRTKFYIYRLPKSALVLPKTEILLFLLANKLVCHNFMNTGRINKTLR